MSYIWLLMGGKAVGPPGQRGGGRNNVDQLFVMGILWGRASVSHGIHRRGINLCQGS